MFKPILEWISPGGSDARLSVFIFHRVLPRPDPLFPDELDAKRFNELCGWLKGWFNVMQLDEAVVALKVGKLPARAACITFDDGYADNYQVALPILTHHSLTATFFIATDFLDGGRMWNDTVVESVRRCDAPNLDLSNLGLGAYRLGSTVDRQVAISSLIGQIKYLPASSRSTVTKELAEISCTKLPVDLMMTSQEIKAMRDAGMQIGAHTLSHPILARMDTESARQEIEASKFFLEKLLGQHVGLFAYPNGKPGEDYSPDTVGIVRSLGFDAAVSTAWGASKTGDDVFQIRRFTPWDKSRFRFGLRSLDNFRRK